MSYSLSIIIPAYNDEVTISQVIKEALDTAKSVSNKFQILILDDGSKDETGETIKKLAQEHKNLKVIQHVKNFGFGQTLKTLFLNKDYEVNLLIPGDGQIRPREIFKMWPYLKKYDFILGRRRIRKDNLKRKIGSYVYNTLVSIISKRRITDVNSIVLYKTRIFNNINLESKSALIHAELLIKANKKGYKLCEIPIEHFPRTSGRGSGGKLTIIVSTAVELIKKWKTLSNYR